MHYYPSMPRNKCDNFCQGTSQLFMVDLKIQSILWQNCFQLLLSLLRAAELSQKPLENDSALQLSLLLFSILVPFTREENKSFSIWIQLHQIIKLIQVLFFSLDFTLNSPATKYDVTSEASQATTEKW